MITKKLIVEVEMEDDSKLTIEQDRDDRTIFNFDIITDDQETSGFTLSKTELLNLSDAIRLLFDVE